jgi:hypothetical protein
MSEQNSDISSTLSDKISELSDAVSPSSGASPGTTAASSSKSVGSYFENTNTTTWLKWGLIILILAFLGFNIFTYLSKATDTTATFLQPLFTLFGKTATKTIDKTAEGTKLATNVAAGTVTSGIDVLQKTIDGNKERTNIDDDGDDLDRNQDSETGRNREPPVSVPVPDDAGSKTQTSSSPGKAGYCFIGEDRGFRSCVNVNESDQCISGEIFPTQEQCEHPELRQ